MHRIFNLYEIDDDSGLLAIEKEEGVPNDFRLTAIGLVQLRETIASKVRPDTYELILAQRDVWIEIDNMWLHGVSPFSQILYD